MARYLQSLNELDNQTVSANTTANCYLIGRFHEIGLKGRNRWRFVDELKRNLAATFADYRLGPIRGEGLRLKVAIPDEVPENVVRERAALLFGLQNFSLSHRVDNAIEAITQASIATVGNYANGARTFRVSARRTEKRFALNSMEIDRGVGAAIAERFGLKVQLDHPDFEVSIEIMPDGAYVSAGKLEGAGGLPVGVTGRGMVLLSGGIDSPVAAYRMMRRGLRVDFVHFHSYPLVSSASREKAYDLAAHLTRYETRSTLHLVPFAEVQRTIVARAPRPLRVVLYRRFMLRIASAIAEKHGSQVLVTGESLGQVASQTLENMTVIQQAIAMPVLRPLVGMDKNEIVVDARRLGTFETSIMPDQDCCSLFVPAHPETRARLDQVLDAEAALEVDEMVTQAVNKTEMVRNTFPAKSPVPVN
ncbi:MAG TPA: tRNA uracil 4-sulfurtransferase ThiI [Candidatus Binataceae bacterium]|nr:tRNA uracil 4-sulfurtransferase ThiI [Candidatus Binataceae bacterium]